MTTVADEITRRRVDRLTTPEHALGVIDELAARWHRATPDGTQGSGYFNTGRRAGYAQAIGLLLDVPYEQVLQLLRDGYLGAKGGSGTREG